MFPMVELASFGGFVVEVFCNDLMISGGSGRGVTFFNMGVE